MPSVNTLYRDFKGQGFEVLLISFREDPEVVRRTVEARGYTARVLIDQSGEITGKQYGVWGTPTAYFVDRRGRLVGRIFGPRGWGGPAVRTFIRALLDADPKR